MPRDVDRAPVSLDVARTRYVAGETVVARMLGVTSAVEVALLRVESRPCGDRVVVVANRHLDEPFGSFELTIPPRALPSARGAECALSYVLQARAEGVVARAELEISAEGRPHLESRPLRADPLIANWDARHFHLELSDAVLRGGGRIAGRVHRHGAWRSHAIVVRVRCDECWRRPRPAARGMPYWRAQTLWEAADTVDLDPDTTWAPFSFDLPPGLPPAIAARTIAWCYDLLARQHRRHRPDETAALTPLLHEELESPQP